MPYLMFSQTFFVFIWILKKKKGRNYGQLKKMLWDRNHKIRNKLKDKIIDNDINKYIMIFGHFMKSKKKKKIKKTSKLKIK